MEEKEIKKYKKYLKIKGKKRISWFNRIRFWKFLQTNFETSLKENEKKQEKIQSLKRELSAYKIKGEILEKEVSKKGKKKK